MLPRRLVNNILRAYRPVWESSGDDQVRECGRADCENTAMIGKKFCLKHQPKPTDEL